ncbi:MAG: hypothetical protein Q4D92_02345 [Slackia sp.]|nr:hypothetical protein [Slackia sp.]
MTDFNNMSQFDFSFDSLSEEWDRYDGESMDDIGVDPGVFLPNIEGRTEFLAPDAERVPKIPNAIDRDAPAYAERPANERIRELLAHMAPHRRILLGVLSVAVDPCSDAVMAEKVEGLRSHKFSVYSPSNICMMLESAGALERVTESGLPYAQHKPVPRIVVWNGEEYYEPSDAPEVYWRTTEAGVQILAEDDPAGRMVRQLERESEFKSIYKRVLLMASEEGGATMAQLSAAVDGDPLVSNPRRFFVQHFVEAVERCSCVAWQGDAWKTTELGSRILQENLCDVDGGMLEEMGASDRIPTETQGINW